MTNGLAVTTSDDWRGLKTTVPSKFVDDSVSSGFCLAFNFKQDPDFFSKDYYWWLAR